MRIHLPSNGFFSGNSSWHVNSNGTWTQKFTVVDITPGKYALSFTETSGHLRVTGSFRVLSAPNAGQDWSRCQKGSCAIAIDHQRTQVLIAILNGTSTSILYYAAGEFCLRYLGPIAAYCVAFATVVILDKYFLAKQLSESDHGRGVYITWLTVNIHKLPGITPQR